MKALIVDDSRVQRKYLTRIMQAMDWDTQEAENGKVALEALGADDSIALALMDVNMPEMNGIDCVRQLRRELPQHRVRVVIVTTEAGMHVIESVLRDGADEFLMKPFTADNLRDKLQLLAF